MLVNPNTIELRSPLSPAECTTRLLSQIDAEFYGFGFRPDRMRAKPIVGRIDGSSLRLRRRIEYHNSFQTLLSAQMRLEGTGTFITGQFAMYPFVRGCMVLWFTGVVLFEGIAALVAFMSFQPGSILHRDEGWWLILAAPPLMLVFGAGVVKFGRFLARGEAKFITDFLVRTLAVEPSPSAETNLSLRGCWYVQRRGRHGYFSKLLPASHTAEPSRAAAYGDRQHLARKICRG